MKAQIIAALRFASHSYAQSTISSGSGFGTYYYDIEQVQTCGTDFSAQNTGVVECGSSSLDQINSNYLVAMSHTQLAGDMTKYCGKKVIVSVNGVASSLPLFIGDGCVRCASGSSGVWDPNASIGLDFSYSVLSELSSDACSDGHIPISWDIIDETLYNFDTDGTGSAEGPVSGNNTPLVTTFADPATTTSTSASAAHTQESVASSSPISVDRLVDVPTTLVTLTNPVGAGSLTISSDLLIATVTSSTAGPVGTGFFSIPSDLPTAALPTASISSGSCETGAWQCNGNVLEQCLGSTWTFRFICNAELTCQGGIRPYCAPPGFESALELNSIASVN